MVCRPSPVAVLIDLTARPGKPPQDTRYVVIARKVSKDQKEAILSRKYKGIGAQEQQYRTYPNGSLAAQVLGFVNNDAKGV